ncbi:MEDS domain-containing protein [Psychrobacillus sp. INOP01]|nr:MEDS domain-containing protein [Psychrobacillus sp. INOP01]QUG43875.1 MEDS domain-containing protein [Psychrobacillus sp. INOP01]
MHEVFENNKDVHLHILYKYRGIENYIIQILSYIEDGVAAGDYVILIENSRLYPIIQKELSTRFTVDQLELVHYVNSLDFYWSSGSYHPPSIADYFSKTVQPYVENKISFRAWAHVEWATMEEPLHLIKDLEEIVDEAVNLLAFPLICAYDGEKLPDYLKTSLMETHPYVLLEDDFIVSEQYQSSKTH